MLKRFWKITVAVFSSFVLSACGIYLNHIPSPMLESIKIKKPVSIMVADVGDLRYGEYPNRVGQGVSFWLPLSFYAYDSSGRYLPVSYYISKSLSEDLTKIGYNAKLANPDEKRIPLTPDEALAIAERENTDYLITVKTKEGKTNFWGFLIIPFAEPVWTKIAMECKLFEMGRRKGESEFETQRKKTEWYFGKITILDAIFDAGLFGKYWHETAWGKTVVSDALAEAAQKISEKIESLNQGSRSKDLVLKIWE
jgi:hypothetical protein